MAKWKSRNPAAPADGSNGGSAGGDGEDRKKTTKSEPDASDGEVVIIVPVHCDGCALKLRRSVKRLDGTEEVTVDCRTNTVVVRGPKAALEPAGVVEVVDRRTGKKALQLSSSPAKPKTPPSPEKNGTEAVKKDASSDQQMGKEMAEEDLSTRVFQQKIEPATLAGLIHKWTGRRAAIFRAEPLKPAPPPSQSPPPPPKVDKESQAAETQPEKEETKQGDPSPPDDLQEMKEREAEEKEEEPDEKEGGGAGPGGEADDLKPQTESPTDASNNGVTEESHSTKDHLFRVALPESVVALAPESEKMAINSLYHCYHYYPAFPYAYPSHQYYQYPQQNYSYAAGYPAMYGYYPRHVSEAFSDENPNVCTIM